MTTTEMKWFEIWFEDRQSVLETMQRNVVADLDAGYNPNGYCICKQKVDIETYRRETERRLNMFATMEDKNVNRWCYYDMKKRGAI